MESLVYALEGLMKDHKDKMSEEEKDAIGKLIADGHAMKDNEEATLGQVKDETDRIQKESEQYFQKYVQTAQQGASEGEKKEEGPVEGEVVDAD